MKNHKSLFSIPFAGLKNGKHAFEFEVGETFFADYEYSGIEDANVRVELVLDKKETMLIGEFSIEGQVVTECARCTDSLEVPVHADYTQYFKFGTEDSEDDSLTVMHPDEYQIDVKDLIYEFIIISLPSRAVHPEGACNEEMMQEMEKHVVNLDSDEDDDYDDDEEDDDDESPWSILKDLN